MPIQSSKSRKGCVKLVKTHDKTKSGPIKTEKVNSEVGAPSQKGLGVKDAFVQGAYSDTAKLTSCEPGIQGTCLNKSLKKSERKSGQRVSVASETQSSVGQTASIQTVVRIRPLLPSETPRQDLLVDRDNHCLQSGNRGLPFDGQPNSAQFSCLLDAGVGTEHLVQYLDGQQTEIQRAANTSIILYGVSGSGKTYTLFGKNKALSKSKGRKPQPSYDGSGLFFSFVERLFNHYQCDGIKVQAFEVLGKTITDLNTGKKVVLRSSKDGKLHYRYADGSGTVRGLNQTKDLYSGEAFLCNFNREVLSKRSTEATHYNAESSRSHLFLQVDAGDFSVNFVDLAGHGEDFENRTGHTAGINVSLFSLTHFVRSIAEKRNHLVSRRNSVLTRMLANYLDHSKGYVIGTVSPALEHKTSTQNTLDFLEACKKIKRAKTEPNQGFLKILNKFSAPQRVLCDRDGMVLLSQGFDKLKMSSNEIEMKSLPALLESVDASKAPTQDGGADGIELGTLVGKNTIMRLSPSDTPVMVRVHGHNNYYVAELFPLDRELLNQTKIHRNGSGPSVNPEELETLKRENALLKGDSEHALQQFQKDIRRLRTTKEQEIDALRAQLAESKRKDNFSREKLSRERSVPLPGLFEGFFLKFCVSGGESPQYVRRYRGRGRGRLRD